METCGRNPLVIHIPHIPSSKDDGNGELWESLLKSLLKKYELKNNNSIQKQR